MRIGQNRIRQEIRVFKRSRIPWHGLYVLKPLEIKLRGI